MTVKGIDVASYQSTDYSTSGLDFVFVKVTEGTSYTNPKWVAQRDHGRKSGLVIGYYHFVRSGSMSAQGDYFLSKIKLVAGDMLVLDWEDPGVSGADKDAWIRRVQGKAPGHRVLLYCNRDYWFNRDTTSFAGDGLWIADPAHDAGHPAVEHPWKFHQYSSAGGIDRNVGNFADRAALTKWAGGKPAPAKPTVDLSKLIAAAKADPPKHGTPVSYAGTKTVENALVAEGLLPRSLADGHFGTATVSAYAAWQRRCGYSGKDADGIPGKASLGKLAGEHGFKVVD